MGQGKYILSGTLVFLIGIALGAISDIDSVKPNWNSISSILTVLPVDAAAIAAAIAAGVAILVYLHQRNRDNALTKEERSKFYMNECLHAVRNATQGLRDGNHSPESFISAGLLLGEVTQLEHYIDNSEHRRLYRLHRQFEIDQTLHIFFTISDENLRGSIFNHIDDNDLIILGSRTVNNPEALKDTFFYIESLLEGEELITPFPGIPLGRLLCIYRFFINDPHYTKPANRLTNRERQELTHLKPINGVRDYINDCLSFNVKDNAIVLRDKPIKLEHLNMNYDMVITRNYID